MVVEQGFSQQLRDVLCDILSLAIMAKVYEKNLFSLKVGMTAQLVRRIGKPLKEIKR